MSGVRANLLKTASGRHGFRPKKERPDFRGAVLNGPDIINGGGRVTLSPACFNIQVAGVGEKPAMVGWCVIPDTNRKTLGGCSQIGYGTDNGDLGSSPSTTQVNLFAAGIKISWWSGEGCWSHPSPTIYQGYAAATLLQRRTTTPGDKPCQRLIKLRCTS